MSVEEAKAAGLFDCRDIFAATLAAMAAEDGRVCAVVNDSVSSTKLKGFRSRYPKRFVNVGIAEQNMVKRQCRPREMAADSILLWRFVLSDCALDGAGEGRSWLCEEQC